MSEPGIHVTVVGAGGVGCALGHALLTGGVDVTLVEADDAKLEWGRRNGVAVDDRPPQPANLVGCDRWTPAEGDLVLLCTKCYHNRAVLERVPEGVDLVPVQNGFDAELMNRVGVEGIASFVSECLPGRTHTRITRTGDLHIGPCVSGRGGDLAARIEWLVHVLAAHGSFTVRRVPEVLPYKNAKLMYNAAISPLASMAGLDNGELLTVSAARPLFFALLRENHRILKNAAAPLARIGPFHPDTVDRLLGLPLIARLLAIPFALTLRGSYCSMAVDLGNGPTELDNYNGHLLRLAGDSDAPINRAVYSLVQRIENEGLQPDARWLDELPLP